MGYSPWDHKELDMTEQLSTPHTRSNLQINVGQVMVESSDKTWSTGEGNGKPLKYSCLENPMNSVKRAST